MAEDLKNQPNYTNAAYRKMERGWTVMRDTCGGTLHLRDKGTAYLPQEPAEKNEHYGVRLSRAIFFNAVERTLHGLVGMVFRKEPKLSEDVPEIIRGREAAEGQSKIEGQWENIDNAGTHGAVFCKEVFTDAVRDGHAAILVDMPPPLPPGATLDDERRSGRRPYWVSYKAEQIINWRTRVINGETKLDLIVFKECSQEADGLYGEQEVTRYRVLRPGSWELYREIKGEGNKADIVPDPDSPRGKTTLPEIPVAIVYSRKLGTLVSQPPLLDLALTNVAHYQKYSDASTYLHIASRPILWFRNRDKSKKVESIGAYTFFDVGENGEVSFAETTGAALEAASNDIKDLEGRMAVMGLSVVEGKSKPQAPTTATEEILDHVRSESDLATAARSLQDAIELCLKFHAQYLDKSATSGGSVELGATIEELTLTPQELQTYSGMVASKQLSLDSLWALMARAGKLPEDFDAEKEKDAIKATADDFFDQALRDLERGGKPDEREPDSKTDDDQ